MHILDYLAGFLNEGGRILAAFFIDGRSQIFKEDRSAQLLDRKTIFDRLQSGRLGDQNGIHYAAVTQSQVFQRGQVYIISDDVRIVDDKFYLHSGYDQRSLQVSLIGPSSYCSAIRTPAT